MGFKLNRIKKKLVLLGMLGIVTTTLTGCGNDLYTFATSDLTAMLDDRFNKNIDIVKQLYEVGLITQLEHDGWIKHINTVKDSTLKEREVTIIQDGEESTAKIRCTDLTFDDKGKVKGTTHMSFSRIQTYTLEGVLNAAGISDANKQVHRDSIEEQGGMTFFSLGNYLASEYALNMSNWSEGEFIERSDENVKPIHIIAQGTAFDDGLDFDIRVLKENMTPEEMDKVVKELGQADLNYGEIDKYFVDATDMNGDKILFSELINLNKSNLIAYSIYADSIARKRPDEEGGNMPGYDMGVYQLLGDGDFYTGAIRFYEFNSREMNKVLKFMGIDAKTGMNTHKWILRTARDSGNNVLYLMEYPVYYVTGFQDYTNTDGTINKNKVEAQLQKSTLSINLKTHDIIYNFNGASSVITSDGDPYLTFGDSLNVTEAGGLSSFVASGAAKININEGLDFDNPKEIVIPRIILRDYLEITYAPGFDTSDDYDLVVLGRKLRLVNFSREDAGTFYGGSGVVTRSFELSEAQTKISELKSKSNSGDSGGSITNPPAGSGSGDDLSNLSIYKDILGVKQLIPLAKSTQKKLVFDKNEPIAQFVSADGVLLTDSPSIMINELGSIPVINGSTPYVARLGDTVESIGAKHPRDAKETETVDGLYQYVTQNYVNTTTSFPGTAVGKEDYLIDKAKMADNAKSTDTHIHQQFYGMFVSTNLFDNGLFSSWLNSPDENASLAWWIEYLEANGYSYALSTGAVENYLYDNFKYELQQNGIVMLDLEVVHKIQEEFDEDTERETVSFIRTVFKTLGWALIVYASILFLAWQLDTNADIGLRLTNTLTLGNWEPIKDIKDCPYMDTSGVKYVDMQRLGISCMIILLTGVLLIIIDVYDIVLLLIRMLGVLAQEVNEILTGII